MRNNQHNEPNLSNGRIEPQLDSSDTHSAPLLDNYLIAEDPTQRSGGRKTIGFLFVLTLAIAGSATAFGWWSYERLQLLEQQLIATQDSFSKVSEEATGRINAITGQVSDAENSVLSGTEDLNKRLVALEKSTVSTQKQHQSDLTENASNLTLLSKELASQTKRTIGLQSTVEEQQARIAQQKEIHETTLAALHTELSANLDTHQENLKQLQTELTANQERLKQLDKFATDLNDIHTDLAALQKNTGKDTVTPNDITRLQQDVLILRTELENQPAPKAAPARNTGPSLADFDAYRAQTNRTITALQEQVRNLQK